MARTSNLALATELAQAGDFLDPETRAIVPPIHPSTTFAREQDYTLGGYSYGRDTTPTVHLIEQLLARLEGAAASLVFGSGLAAATAVFDHVQPGQQIAVPRVMYHGLQTWLRRIAPQRGITLRFFDATTPDGLESAVAAGETAIVWVETLANPTWDVTDLAKAAGVAHDAGAALAVDATVTPPVTIRPIEQGADIVFHSATKYLNGHSDVMGGVLSTRAVDDHWQDIGTVRTLAGGVMGPFEAWLLMRGMRTLAIRFERASANALEIAQHFEGHPAIASVLYPGLPSHRDYDLATRQLTGGFGGMLSLRIKGGENAARTVATKTKLFRPATSLGGVESLIEHRIAVEPPESAVPRDLLRLSIGIEDSGDLIDDLETALRETEPGHARPG
ncbi:MAG: trans-sulfuration enzyme family protein [Geminicoccaceae bacterium]